MIIRIEKHDDSYWYGFNYLSKDHNDYRAVCSNYSFLYQEFSFLRKVHEYRIELKTLEINRYAWTLGSNWIKNRGRCFDGGEFFFPFSSLNSFVYWERKGKLIWVLSSNHFEWCKLHYFRWWNGKSPYNLRGAYDSKLVR